MNSYDKIMWGKIIIPFQEVLIDLPETPDEPKNNVYASFIPIESHVAKKVFYCDCRKKRKKPKRGFARIGTVETTDLLSLSPTGHGIEPIIDPSPFEQQSLFENLSLA